MASFLNSRYLRNITIDPLAKWAFVVDAGENHSSCSLYFQNVK